MYVKKTYGPPPFLYDINKDCWWPEMLHYLDITAEQLPDRKGCGQPAGMVSALASGQTGLSPRYISGYRRPGSDLRKYWGRKNLPPEK